MPLRTCPDCGKEVSTAAQACPNCGFPFQTQTNVVEERVVHNNPEKREAVPKWLVIPVVVLVGALIVLFIFMLRSGDDADERNVNVDISAGTTDGVETDRTPQTVKTPVDTAPPDNVEIPDAGSAQTVPADTEAQVSDQTADRGSVSLEAKVADKTGKVAPVDNEKFYLLDKDLNAIFREAGLQSLPGQTLVNSFGLSVLYPDKYADFNRKALEAIEDHVKYNTLTSSGGRAELKDVEPKTYYLFGIHKTGNGFAIWNSPVTIKAGQNKLNIQPQRTTDISE
jgi:hypothetical protein